jgi:hypothetical protein
MVECFVCRKGEMKENVHHKGWYYCTYCEEDSDEVLDGFAYPTKRRDAMCSLYTPVYSLDVNMYNEGDIIEFSTSRKTIKKAKILHVDKKSNQMIIEDGYLKTIRFVVDNKDIADAYEDLFPTNKVELSGWWHRRIEIIS